MPVTFPRLLLASTLACCGAGAAFADPILPYANIPVPGSRPYAAIEAAVSPQPMTTGAIARTGSVTAPNPQSVARLKSGLDALARNDVRGAMGSRDALPAGSLDRRILSWAIALSGADAVPSLEIARTAHELSGWPGMAALRRNSERAMFREKPAAREVVAAFGNSEPMTREGVFLLTRARMAMGDQAAARRVIANYWRDARLEAREESALLSEFGRLLTAADHAYRTERMLHFDRIASAERAGRLAGREALVKAWAAVIRGEGNAGRLLEAVPRDQRTSGWIFASTQHLRRAGKYKEAAAMIQTAPTEAARLVDPDIWWIERRVLSREMMEIGDLRSAYRIAAAHAAQRPANIADAEFHAGWYALRLGDHGTASRHFARIAQIADGSISLARAHYWQGRAAEAAGNAGQAAQHYRRAAQHSTAFYGQVAAAKLGQALPPPAFPQPSQSERLSFERREAVQAIRRLEDAGHASRAAILYRDLAGELPSAGELALLAVMAERRGDHFLALRVGKIAASRGLEVGALAHPVGAIPDSARISGAGKALAYAIARQESEFNVGAVSPAGARGLLQLLPGTARDMARKAGLPYSQARLTTDPGYNATLGAAFLAEQLERFSGSYVLTFAGYNAGPSRAQQWIQRYGDPRGRNIDAVVDWIEMIPFTETRGYVQRVMENYQVYKLRLSGRFDIAVDLTRGR